MRYAARLIIALLFAALLVGIGCCAAQLVG